MVIISWQKNYGFPGACRSAVVMSVRIMYSPRVDTVNFSGQTYIMTKTMGMAAGFPGTAHNKKEYPENVIANIDSDIIK